jgi:hypothetical protein
VAVFVFGAIKTRKKHMKSLPIVVIAGYLFAVSWGTPLVRADATKFAAACSCSQSAADGSPIYSLGGSASDGSEAAPAAQAPGSTTKSLEHTGVSGLFWKWFKMGERTQAGEPNWLSPLATTSGRLKQEFRYDVWRQPGTPGDTDYNFGGGKGLEFIAAPHVQLMLGAPPYIAHEGGKTPDGYADIPVMMKVGLAAAGPGEGDYLVTLLLSATVPGGSASMRDAVISPGIALGKGWRNFDVQTTLGGNLPTGDISTIGRQLVSNTAFQYRALWRLWPEVEVNSTSFVEGKDAGQTQVFLTPGLGFGRIRLWRALKFSAAAGVQIAATRFHTYNHRAMFSVRYSF